MFYLQTRAAALADAVTPGDIRRAVWAARFFHSMHVLPILLYYVVPFEEPLMFPCSLSFTQRKGYPYVAYHVLKLALGWPLLASVLLQQRRCAASADGHTRNRLSTYAVRKPVPRKLDAAR